MKPNPVNDIPKFGESRSDIWIQWYNELKDSFGRKEAAALFMKAWVARGTSSANTSALRTVLKSDGISIDESALDKIVDLGGGVADFFGSALTIGKWTGIAVIVVIVGGAGLLIYNIAKAPGENVGTAVKYAK